MKLKKNTKGLLAFVVMLFSISSVMAQNNVSAIYGTYTGNASTTIYKVTDNTTTNLSGKQMTFALSEGEGGFTKIVLKGYRIGKLAFEDIAMLNNKVEQEGEVLSIKQDANVSKYFEAKDEKGHKFSVNLTLVIDKEGSSIDQSGVLKIKMSIYYDNLVITHSFQGKKNVANGISAVHPADSDKPMIIHDLQGRRVTSPGRGVYIVNGKKVVM